MIQFGLAILSRYKSTLHLYLFPYPHLDQILNTNIEELGSFIRDELRQLNDNEVTIQTSPK